MDDSLIDSIVNSISAQHHPRECLAPSCVNPCNLSGYCSRHALDPGLFPSTHELLSSPDQLSLHELETLPYLDFFPPLPEDEVPSTITLLLPEDQYQLLDTHRTIVESKAPKPKPTCDVTKCSNQAQTRGLCTTHHNQTQVCLIPGCSAPPRSKRLCASHGGQPRCDVSDCAKQAQNASGKCKAHHHHHGGNNVKLKKAVKPKCHITDCHNVARIQGLCCVHGGKEICHVSGCSHMVVKAHRCAHHHHHSTYAKCATPGCVNKIKFGRSCHIHYQTPPGVEKTPVKKCSVPECPSPVSTKGFCSSHWKEKKCQVNKCSRVAIDARLCIEHQPQPECQKEHCTLLCVYQASFCRKHGGNSQCKHPGCVKKSTRHGFCYTHGGYNLCSVEACSTPAHTKGICRKHRRQEGSASSMMCRMEKCTASAIVQGYCAKHVVTTK